MAERLRVREIDDDGGQRLPRIVRRGSGPLKPATLRRRKITRTIPEKADQIRNRKNRAAPAAAHPRWTPNAASSGTLSHAASTGSSATLPRLPL